MTQSIDRQTTANQKRQETRRKNEHERREKPMDEKKDCENNCTLAAKSNERLNAAFARIDEIRDETKALDKEIGDKLEKQYGYIQERVRFQLFVWVIGAHIAISGTLMSIIWTHFLRADNLTDQTINQMEIVAKDNAKDIGIAVTRIDDYINAQNEASRRSESDQDRILKKLEEIERSVRDLQINFAATKKQ